jgi:hypothetical protein
MIVDYRLFGAPLPRADALPRVPSLRSTFPRLNIHVNLLDDHWSISSGHWSAGLAARYEQIQAARDQAADELHAIAS